MKSSLEWLRNYLVISWPREVRMNLTTKPDHHRLHGWAIEERVTVGGVIFDGTCPPEYFSEVVPQPIFDG